VPGLQARNLIAQSAGELIPRRALARVHSVFRRACNLESERGELITLLGVEAGNLPRGLRCAPAEVPLAHWLHPGQLALIDGGVLQVPEARLCVDFSRAPAWHCERVGIDLRERAVAPALERLRGALRGHPAAQGFAPLLFSPGGAQSSLERSIAARLQRALPALAHALRQRRADEAGCALAQLAGLGVGLTPSGDDFIVGFLAALWSRGAAERGTRTLLEGLAAPLARLALHSPAISRQQLIDAIHGHFAQHLVELLRALSRGEAVETHAARVLYSGHSSGADTVTGLLFGLRPAAVIENPPMTHRTTGATGRALAQPAAA
jgi:hypothetical protein